MDPEEPEPKDEEGLREELRQLRAALKLYRELVERLMRERKPPA
jgi:hypothetical protein